jgi:hypothetical protein
MPKVFISYRHVAPDQELAAELARFLEGNGLSVFVDARIRIGQEWVDEIDRQLRSAQYFVVLLSAESIRSDMVRQEIALAHTLRSEKRLRIFPVRVAFGGELPYDLGAYLNLIQYQSWTQNESFAPICRAILQEIQAPADTSEPEQPHEVSNDSLRLLAQATELRGAPLPSADPRLETGAVGMDSPFYIRRAEDDRVEGLIPQTGVTVLIKGPRQVGKTSLLARAQALAREKSQRTLYLDFQLIDESHFETLKGILLYFAHRISRELRTAIKPADVWDDAIGAPESLTDFVEQAALESTPTVLSIVLDEADRIFQCKFRNGFFAMIRAWHNLRSRNPLWKRLNIVIGHSTEPALFIDDINQSPFNVGEIIRLGDFTAQQVDKLNEIHGRPLRSVAETSELMRLVGGHPYLVRQSFYSLCTSLKSLQVLRQVAVNESGPFGDHLRHHLWVLRDREPLRKALKQVIREGRCSDELHFQRLRAGGMLEGDSHENARLRCDLYRQYFASRV